MSLTAVFRNGVWVVRAVVGGELREYAARTLPGACFLLKQDKAGVLFA